MKALIYQGPQHLDYGESPMPQPLPGEVLVRVAYVGICGSDMHAYLGHDARRPAPLILGHEVAGIVHESEERVTLNPLVRCGHCTACSGGHDNLCVTREIISMPPRQGGFAQYLTIPARNLVPVPDAVSLAQATLCEPIACGWHGVRKAREYLGEDRFNKASALILGGGAIGVGAALALRAQGINALKLCEAQAHKRRYLEEKLNFDIISPEQLEGSTPCYTLVIDAVGLCTTRTTASAAVLPGGVIVHIGLGSAQGGLDIRRMTLQEIGFIGTYTYSAQDFHDTAKALFDRKLGALDWVQTRPLAEGAQAFIDLKAGICTEPKTLLKP